MASKDELKRQIRQRLDNLKDSYFAPDAATKAGNITSNLGSRRTLKGHFQKVYSIHWAGRDSDMLVSASQDGKLLVWNAQTEGKLNAINLKSPWVMSCAFEQQENGIVASGGLDNVCSLFRLGDYSGSEHSQPLRELEAHLGYISCTRFLDSDKVVTSSGDNTCRLWSVNRGVCLNFFREHQMDVMSLDVHPESPNVFVSGSLDLECKLWDTRTKAAVATMKPQANEKPLMSRYLYGLDEDDMEGVEIPSTQSFTGHESDINTVAFHPSGFAFGSGSDDSTCRLWDVRCHQEINKFKSDQLLGVVSSVQFSKSGRSMFAGYDDHTLVGWDTLVNPAEGNQQADPFWSIQKHEAKVTSLSVHSSGKALASASWDTLIHVFA